MDEETIRKNMAGIKAQLSRFIDFNSTASNAAIMLNNYDWMKQFSFLDFIREIGKHITVNYMMAKDSVKKRLSSEMCIRDSYKTSSDRRYPFFDGKANPLPYLK